MVLRKESKNYFGYVTIIGRPNVGKSTLFNYLLGHKISVVTRKAQTTQVRIMGVITDNNRQFVLLDTPGVQMKLRSSGYQRLNAVAKKTTYEADVAVFVTGGLNWRRDDDKALATLNEFQGPVIAVVNKLDLFMQDKKAIDEYVEKLKEKRDFEKVILVSARRKINVDVLQRQVLDYLPEGRFLYDSDDVTEHGDEFVLSDIIRSKCLEFLHEEIPYECKVEIESMLECEKHIEVRAIIWVPTSAKKGILIGKQGQKLKQIGQSSRVEMSKYLGEKVVLKNWVKIGTPEIIS